MALIHLLYLCPRCGHDPLVGEKDQALCPDCGIQFFRGGAGGLITIRDQGKEWDVPGSDLTAVVRARSATALAGSGDPGVPIREATVLVRQSGEEAPVRWQGQLMGFAEKMGEASEGDLRLFQHSLQYSRASGDHASGGEGVFSAKWDLLDIRAVQTSSRALQFSPSAGNLVEFRFPHDSPYRWENLLRGALKEVYRRAGLGEIVEFQPRIVAE